MSYVDEGGAIHLSQLDPGVGKDIHALKRERDALRAQVERMQRVVDAARKAVAYNEGRKSLWSSTDEALEVAVKTLDGGTP